MSTSGSSTAPGNPRPVYGNYRAYYRKRQLGANAAQQDPRLHSLFAFLRDFSSPTRPAPQRVLDIGCNSGRVTVQLASLLQPPPAKVVGIDLDQELIRQAKNSLRHTWSRRRPASEWDERIKPPPAFSSRECARDRERRNNSHRAPSPAGNMASTPATADDEGAIDPHVLADLRFFPACFPPLLGSLSFPVSDPATVRSKLQFDSDLPSRPQTPRPTFPNNCHFVVADVMDDTSHRGTWFPKGDEFDLLVCLSLTKWIHVHHGDKGLLNLLDQFSTMLAPRGLLLLEPHDTSSYERTKELPTAVRKALAERPLEIKPEQLLNLLEQRGFDLVSRTCPGKPNHGAPGREVLLFIRR